MTEIFLTVCSARYLYTKGQPGKLNPKRIERYYVRGKSRADCARILSEHGPEVTPYYLKNHGLFWGTGIDQPAHEGRGLWLTRDPFSRELVEVWIDKL